MLKYIKKNPNTFENVQIGTKPLEMIKTIQDN